MTELNISLPPPKESPNFDEWMNQTTQYLRDYLGLYDSSTTVPGSQVSFLQLGTGATTRTIEGKAQDTVSVKDFGAVGDGIFASNGAITNTDKTFTSAGAAFVSADIGKLIKVGGAGASGATLITTIASITSGTEVELTAAAGTTVTGANYTYGTDDTTEIQAAIDACHASGKTLVFPDGRYCFTLAMEFAKSFWTVRPEGNNTWLESFRTTSGPAVSLNGLTYNATYGCYRFEFGGDYPFNIRGNSNCSSVLYYNNVHFGRINANLRDGNIGILGNHVLGGGTAGPGAAVDTEFIIRLAHHDLDTFDTVPDVGWYMTQTYACRIRMQIEVSGDQANNFGVYMTASNGNVFWGGTVESCNYGGMWITSTANRNIFFGTHNEFNGDGPDWKIDGNYNVLIGCAGAGTYADLGTAANLIGGDYTIIVGGEFNDLEITADADNTQVLGSNLATGTVSDNSATTTFTGCNGVVDKAPPPVLLSPTLGTGVTDTGSPYKPAKYCRTRAGMVQIEGVVTMGTVSSHPTTILTIPTGYRPSLSIVFTAYNLTTDVVIGLVLNSSGVLETQADVATSDVISIFSPPFIGTG